MVEMITKTIFVEKMETVFNFYYF